MLSLAEQLLYHHLIVELHDDVVQPPRAVVRLAGTKIYHSAMLGEVAVNAGKVELEIKAELYTNIITFLGGNTPINPG